MALDHCLGQQAAHVSSFDSFLAQGIGVGLPRPGLLLLQLEHRLRILLIQPRGGPMTSEAGVCVQRVQKNGRLHFLVTA